MPYKFETLHLCANQFEGIAFLARSDAIKSPEPSDGREIGEEETLIQRQFMISTWACVEGLRARFLKQEKGRDFKLMPSSAMLGKPHTWYGSSETAKRRNASLGSRHPALKNVANIVRSRWLGMTTWTLEINAHAAH